MYKEALALNKPTIVDMSQTQPNQIIASNDFS